jgi:hypothetical protein
MFWKVIKYRAIIIRVVYLDLKYMFVRSVYSNRKYLKMLNSNYKHKELKSINEQSFFQLLILIEKTLNFIHPKILCLENRLIKRDILLSNGIYEVINLGVLSQGNELKAHAWLSFENNSNYSLVYQIR